MNIQEFILYLGENPYKFLAVQENADAVMEEVGLSDSDRETLKSGDMSRIGAAIVASQQKSNP